MFIVSDLFGRGLCLHKGKLCKSVFDTEIFSFHSTVNPVLRGHSKIDTTKILMTNGDLMKVESIAECSGAFCNTFELH